MGVLGPRTRNARLQSRRSVDRSQRQDPARHQDCRFADLGRALLHPALRLPAGVSRQHPELLPQPAQFRPQAPRHRRTILRQAEPAADEMEVADHRSARRRSLARVPDNPDKMHPVLSLMGRAR